MGIFNFGAVFSTAGDIKAGDTGSGDAQYAADELLGAYKDLTYHECRNIYRYWPLGKRIASALPNFAMSAGRTFQIGEDLPEVVDALEKAAKELNIEAVANRAAIYSRIYGLSFIYAAADKSSEEPLLLKDLQNSSFKLNVLDPLSYGGSIVIDNNPVSTTFGLPVSLRIRGHKVHTQRLCVVYNDIPLYYKYTPSSFSFSGPSIYQNMTLLIRSWNRAVIALQRLATKAAGMVVKVKDTQYATGIHIEAIQKNLELIRSIENDGIASIRVGEEVDFFALTGVQEVDVILQKLHSALMMALSDTPSGILLDKNLAQSMSDGDNDMKAIIIAVDRFRKDLLAPIYKFVDKFLCYRAFAPQLIKEVKEAYPDLYRDKTEKQILAEWLEGFSYEFNDLYPQTENEQADTASKKLDNLTKIKELGGELSGIEEAINSSIKPFGNIDFVLDEEKLAEQDELNSDSSRESGEESREAAKTIDSPDEGAEH